MSGVGSAPDSAGVGGVGPDADVAVARTVFAAGMPQAIRFHELLAGPGIQRGLIGPREVPRLWQRHILNSAVLASALADVPAEATVVDIGSGAGLPGIPLAILRPDIRVMLLEPMQRRCDFLTETIAALGLSNCSVLRSRAEDAVGLDADAVTSRAVAAMDKLAIWSVPLLRDGGIFLPLKGSRAYEELNVHGSVLKSLGLVDLQVLPLGADVLDQVTFAVSARLDRDKAQRDRVTQVRGERPGRCAGEQSEVRRSRRYHG